MGWVLYATPFLALHASPSSSSSSSWLLCCLVVEIMKQTAEFRSESLTTPIKISILLLFSTAFFFLGRRFTSSSSQIFFFLPSFTTTTTPLTSSTYQTIISTSPNADKSYDVTSLIQSGRSPPPPIPLPPPPPPAPVTFGVVGDDGAMQDNFEVGELGDDLVEGWDEDGGNGAENGTRDGVGIRTRVGKFRRCPYSMREYIPCLDNTEVIRKLKASERGEKFQRHCPVGGKGLNCLVPVPKDYKRPIPWPTSRDEIWFSNVPHTRLAADKGGQNWIKKEKDKFKFPGGGTQFIHGADQYLNQISEMVPDIAFGTHTRVALDVGCGVASFGAFLLSRNVLTLSIAPIDVHENQIQFALERGVPAMVAAFATHRLSYPSQAFDLIHCSRCRINWTRYDGILLLEINRMLRAGGYFAWAAQPVYKHEEPQQRAWREMEDLTARMCWELVKKEGYIAIWRKPLNNSCYLSRDNEAQPPLCDVEDDPDKVWYVDLKPCITRLPHSGDEANITNWPDRLHVPPARLQTVVMDAYMAKKELFKAESKYWNEIVGSYIRAFHWSKLKLRNVMDMRAGFGGFAAALNDLNIDCWVMNVVPTSDPNTLPVIYDRGLLGVAHDWCEPFDTYSRTYDLLHAAGLFSKEQKRCNTSSILLEMDRMLRPAGRAFFRDTSAVVEEINLITDAMGWRCTVGNTEEGPYANRRLLMCEKQLLRS